MDQSPLLHQPLRPGVVLVRASSSRCRGVTLTEVVISIAVLAVASLITFGVVMRVKDSAKDTTIVANLKQIGMSHLLYAGDYDDGLPPKIPSNVGIPMSADPNDPFDHNKPGAFIDSKSDPLGWKTLLIAYGSGSDQFFSPADPYARSDKVLSGTAGPKNSLHTSVTYAPGSVNPSSIRDGKVTWTLARAEEWNRNAARPLLITNIFEPSDPTKAVTVHRLGRRVPAWYLEGNARIIDLKEASSVHE